MKPIQKNQKKFTINTEDMIRLECDEDGDVLEIFFGENEPATGIELTDDILLRINRTTKRAVSLTIMHLSILAQRTEYGPRSYRLNNLKTLPEDLRESVMHIVTNAPVNQFIKVSYFQASETKRIPFTYVEPLRFAYAA